jgi:hypothetical protein
MWEARLEGVRASLAATEQHARALEQELAARPTNQQVNKIIIISSSSSSSIMLLETGSCTRGRMGLCKATNGTEVTFKKSVCMSHVFLQHNTQSKLKG